MAISHHTHTRALVAFALLWSACAFARAQTQPAKQEPASVSGRVRVGERAAPGVAVVLMPVPRMTDRWVVAQARTDAEGFYRLTGIAPGRYQVAPAAPAHVLRGSTRNSPPGLAFTLAPGDAVEGADFTLTPGGVITGRVTDGDGKPVVGENVQVANIDPNQEIERLPFGSQTNQTDDRGVYRIYGLPAGRYRVSVGYDTKRGIVSYGSGARVYYERTFHPDATDIARAGIVEVTEGGEAADVDIKLGRRSKTFKVEGRFVDATTGQPAPGVAFAYGALGDGSRRFDAIGMPSHRTDARGRFVIEGVMPGRYGVLAQWDGSSEHYSEATVFEVSDRDVSGVEVKLRRGASLRGAVAIEGVSEQARAQRLLRQVKLYAYADARDGLGTRLTNNINVNPDGSFVVAGLRPGRLHLRIGYPFTREFKLLRVEHEGVVRKDGVEIAEGAQVAGVRVALTHGTGVVRGQVIIREDGQAVELPEGARLNLFMRPAGVAEGQYGFAAMVDARGRFLIENVPAGETELMLQAVGTRSGQTNQFVSMTEGGDVSITLIIDLQQTARPKPRGRQ